RRERASRRRQRSSACSRAQRPPVAPLTLRLSVSARERLVGRGRRPWRRGIAARTVAGTVCGLGVVVVVVVVVELVLVVVALDLGLRDPPAQGPLSLLMLPLQPWSRMFRW